MSRKRNSHGKKARDYGGNASGSGMSRHRGSGKSQINRTQRMIEVNERNARDVERAREKRERTTWSDSVEDLMRKERP